MPCVKISTLAIPDGEQVRGRQTLLSFARQVRPPYISAYQSVDPGMLKVCTIRGMKIGRQMSIHEQSDCKNYMLVSYRLRSGEDFGVRYRKEKVGAGPMHF